MSFTSFPPVHKFFQLPNRAILLVLTVIPPPQYFLQGLKKLVYVAKEDPTKVNEYNDGLRSEIEKAGHQ